VSTVLTMVLLLTGAGHAADWPEWGGGSDRNMVSTETGLGFDFEPGKRANGGAVDPASTKGVRWVVPIGSQTYGNPTVAKGKVFVGTNNDGNYREGVSGDYSVVLAFDEATGKFLWQYTAPKLGAGKVNDWEYLGICSSPAVVGDVVYVVSSTGEVVALDIDGQADGNDGAVQDEAQSFVGKGKPPLTLGPSDADVLWRYDMRKELGVFPHNVTSSSVLVVGDKLYVTTSNGTDWSHLNIPSPYAPSLVVLDRNTGALIGEEASGISARTMHSNWSSPGYAALKGGGLVLFGGGDGYLYGFSPAPVAIDGLPTLREEWRLDANAAHYRTKDGQPIKYATAPGPSEIIATPVYADGVVYTIIGQDPEHGGGVGRLTAVDPTQKGDITKTGILWSFDGIGRSISTVAVADGIVFAADYAGKLYAVDQKNGALLWEHDTYAHIWGSPFVVDGRVLLGNEDGVLAMFKVSKKKKELGAIQFTAPIYATPVVANKTLYLATQNHLYAIGATK
jgi:outer membrane protein assembly factor BamB